MTFNEEISVKPYVQLDMTLPECMTLAEVFDTTIFSVKLMHDCNNMAKIL